MFEESETNIGIVSTLLLWLMMLIAYLDLSGVI